MMNRDTYLDIACSVLKNITHGKITARQWIPHQKIHNKQSVKQLVALADTKTV